MMCTLNSPPIQITLKSPGPAELDLANVAASREERL